MSSNNSLVFIRLFRPVFHGAIILGIFRGALLLRKSTDLIPGVQLRIPVVDLSETMIFALLAVILFFVIGVSKGIYELRRPLHSYYKKFLETWFWRVILLFAIAYLGFGFVFVNGISRFVLVWASVGFLLLGTLFDWFWNSLNSNVERKNPYSISLVGNDSELKKRVEESLKLYDIYEVRRMGDMIVNKSISQSVNQKVEMPQEPTGSDIVLAVGSYTKETLQAFADEARISGQRFYHISEHLELEDLISAPSRLGPVMALEYLPSPLEGWWSVVKRIFDIIVSGILILILSPILILVAIAIKLTSSGPVLYRHLRVGKNGQEFLFSKFRTMFTHLSVGEQYGGEEAQKLKQELMESKANVRKGPLQKIENDPRVTGFGSFLRRTSLDELPNLFNVFNGNMSLVGPRPHEPFEVDKYEHRQKRLLSLKPGMTGYAQLFGRDKLPFDEEAKLDLYYIQNWSMLLDLYVLVGTLKVVFKGQ